MNQLLLPLFLLILSCSKQNYNIPVQPQNRSDIRVPIMTSTNYHEWEQARFPGCEEESDENKRIKCAQIALQEFIRKNLRYPAKASCISGKTVVQFVVKKNGKLKDIKVLRDLGGGTKEESLRLVKLMPRWIPAQHKATGYKTEVKFNLPIKFDLK